MRSIKVNDLDSMLYYQVPKWLMDLLIEGKISIGAFKTYVLMYERTRLSARNNWIDKKGEVYIKYSYDELMEDLKSNSKTTVSNNIKDLEKVDLIDKVRCFSSSSIYYLKVRSTEDCTSTEKWTDKSTEDCTNSSIEVCTDSSTENLYTSKNNYNKNNLERTTTNLESKNKIEEIPEKENSSSSLEILEKEKIRQIKSTLQMHGISVATCKNIMDLVYSKHIDLERIKAVLTIAPLKKWEDGAIYKALKENWIIENKKSDISIKTNTVLEKKAKKVIEKNLENKEQRDKTIEEKENLKKIFETFPKHERNYIEQEALKLALEKYHKNIAQVMARTETFFDVLKEYLRNRKIKEVI
ncbi:replication initiator protein A [Fusobacterium ulcerans]|uniref:replication initiator protein A n=1 Tax=Fusobacterium ulcerans TaxID=861 RepID=UPI00241ED041|nr:replication initiator protein A [Fusobacterium ulcerans]